MKRYLLLLIAAMIFSSTQAIGVEWFKYYDFTELEEGHQFLLCDNYIANFIENNYPKAPIINFYQIKFNRKIGRITPVDADLKDIIYFSNDKILFLIHNSGQIKKYNLPEFKELSSTKIRTLKICDSNQVKISQNFKKIFIFDDSSLELWTADLQSGEILDAEVFKEQKAGLVKAHLIQNNQGVFLLFIYSFKTEIYDIEGNLKNSYELEFPYNNPLIISLNNKRLIFLKDKNIVKAIDIFTGKQDYEIKTDLEIISFKETLNGDNISILYKKNDIFKFEIWSTAKQEFKFSTIAGKENNFKSDGFYYFCNDTSTFISTMKIPKNSSSDIKIQFLSSFHINANFGGLLFPEQDFTNILSPIFLNQNGDQILVTTGKYYHKIIETSTGKILKKIYNDSEPLFFQNKEVYFKKWDSIFVYNHSLGQFKDTIIMPVKRYDIRIFYFQKQLLFVNRNAIRWYDIKKKKLIDSVEIEFELKHSGLTDIKINPKQKLIFLLTSKFEIIGIDLLKRNISSRRIVELPAKQNCNPISLSSDGSYLLINRSLKETYANSKLNILEIYHIENKTLSDYGEIFGIYEERDFKIIYDDSRIVGTQQFSANKKLFYGINLETGEKCELMPKPVFSPDMKHYAYKTRYGYGVKELCDALRIDQPQDSPAVAQDFIEIYPNPAKDFINVEVLIDNHGVTELNIFNNTGELVYYEEIKLNIGNGKIQIDISGLPSGIYHLQLIYGEMQIERKFTVIE